MESYVNTAPCWYFLFSFGSFDHISALLQILQRLPITHRVRSKLLSWAHETHLSHNPLELINAPSRPWIKAQPSGHVNHVFFFFSPMSLCLCQNDLSEMYLVMPFSCLKTTLLTPYYAKENANPSGWHMRAFQHGSTFLPSLIDFHSLSYAPPWGHLTRQDFPSSKTVQAVPCAFGASLCPATGVHTLRPSSYIKASWTLQVMWATLFSLRIGTWWNSLCGTY